MDKELSKRAANKLEKRTSIINAAKRLFIDKGFEETSMDDISKQAGLTKRTVYKYFCSKEDLFYGVAVAGAKEFSLRGEEAFKSGRNTLEKIRLSNKAYYRFYIDEPGMFRLLNYQPDNRSNCEASPNFHKLEMMKDNIMKYYMNAVEEGKSDGSINRNLDTRKAVMFAFLTSISLLHMVSSMEKSFLWQNEGYQEDEFLLFSLDLLTDALK